MRRRVRGGGEEGECEEQEKESQTLAHTRGLPPPDPRFSTSILTSANSPAHLQGPPTSSQRASFTPETGSKRVLDHPGSASSFIQTHNLHESAVRWSEMGTDHDTNTRHGKTGHNAHV